MTEVLTALIKSAVVVFALLTGFAYATLLERKLLGRLQVRIGPNRVGPLGLLQPLADGIKLAFKEDVAPRGADRLIFAAAPLISTTAALIAFAVIPIGPQVNLFGLPVDLIIADVNVGILYFLAVSSMGVYGIVLAGWASNSKYSLLGSVRATAQLISYELALGLSLIGVVMIAGSLKLTDIVEYQQFTPMVVLQPLGFIIFTIAAYAETNRAPFDMAEAEQELTAGYHTEYSGMKFAMFFMAEYIGMITISSIATTMFLGGYHGPVAPGPWWFVLKVFVLMCGFIWTRATIPRLRYDRLMKFGWQILLPLALLNVGLTAIRIVILG